MSLVYAVRVGVGVVMVGATPVGLTWMWAFDRAHLGHVLGPMLVIWAGGLVSAWATWPDGERR